MIQANPITAVMMRRFPLIVDRKRKRVNYIWLNVPRGYLPAVYGCDKVIREIMTIKAAKDYVDKKEVRKVSIVAGGKMKLE